MAISLIINGVSYAYPQTGNENWGDPATNWALAVSTGLLQKAGGSFTITSEVDFGTNFGLKSLYYKTESLNIALSGQLRLAQLDTITWRNITNSGDLSLSLSALNVLQFNGRDLTDASSTQVLTNKTFDDSTTLFQNTADSTKKLSFSLSGLSTATTRILSIPNATDTIAVLALAQTLTNKTIIAPLGIIKADVGLANVDNTSDVTKNAAVATLTNKTIITPLGLVKNDVGLGNVDNTSDATKNTAIATLANKSFSNELTITDIVTPSNPPGGSFKLYPKTDGFYQLDPTGTETKFATASSLLSISTKSGNYSLTVSDDIILANVAGGAFTLSLPSPIGISGKVFRIKKIDTTLNQVLISGMIDGWTNPQIGLTNNELEIASNGTNWYFLKYPNISIIYQANVQSVSNGGVIDFNTKLIDTQNAVNRSAGWKFIVPVSGLYSISANILLDPNTSYVSSQLGILDIAKNGFTVTQGYFVIQNAGTQSVALSASTLVQAVASDIINFILYTPDHLTQNLNGNAPNNSVSINRISL